MNIYLGKNDAAIIFKKDKWGLNLPNQKPEDEAMQQTVMAFRCAVFLQEPKLVEMVDEIIENMKARPLEINCPSSTGDTL